jgi:hypothetical protein
VRNNGVKYIKDIVTGEEQLYDLRADPGEQHDIKEVQPKALVMIQTMAAPEERSFIELIDVDPGEVSISEAAMLEQLGYTE